MIKYTNMMQGEDTRIEPHNLTDDGLALAPGQRCTVTQGNNKVMLDRALIEAALQIMDAEVTSGKRLDDARFMRAQRLSRADVKRELMSRIKEG